MNVASRYLKIVEWSDEDGCSIGSCPELFYGGCHGDDERQVFDELCLLVEEIIEVYFREGTKLPKPLAGMDLVNRMDWRELISSRPEIRHGRAYIKEARVP